jgi:hypothetical protein
MHLRVLVIASLLASVGCVGGEPRRPERKSPYGEPDYGDGPARDEDRWSVDAHLPRSGDPAHPNVKEELSVVDVRSSDDLFVGGAVRGTVVRGIVRTRAVFAAGARSGRASSRTASFIVVQAGRSGQIQMTREARMCVGTYQGLWVHVVSAGPEGVELSLDPYVSPTARPGEHVSGAGTFRLAPGQSAVIGGFEGSRQAERRTWGSYGSSSSSQNTLVLLSVDVLG